MDVIDFRCPYRAELEYSTVFTDLLRMFDIIF